MTTSSAEQRGRLLKYLFMHFQAAALGDREVRRSDAACDVFRARLPAPTKLPALPRPLQRGPRHPLCVHRFVPILQANETTQRTPQFSTACRFGAKRCRLTTEPDDQPAAAAQQAYLYALRLPPPARPTSLVVHVAMALQRSHLVVAISLLTVRLAMAQTCYFPNGTSSPDFIPCDTGGEHSACCTPTDECLTNGLCRPSTADSLSNEFWRDLCTDPTWESDACPKYCFNTTTSEFSNIYFNYGETDNW